MTTEKNIKKDDRKAFMIGGGTMLGIGVGFFLLPLSALFFVGSIMAGIGLSLIVSVFIKPGNN